MSNAPVTVGAARWLTPSLLIDLVRDNPGITRAAAAQHLGIGSGAATELMTRLRRAALLDETPAPASGRGRPTSILHVHPDGPVVVTAELNATGWRVATAEIDAVPHVQVTSTKLCATPELTLAEIATAIGGLPARDKHRVRAISVSVAGTIRDDKLAQLTALGWTDVDLAPLATHLTTAGPVPMLLGNDATLGGLAEARTGSARGVGTVLHLLIAVGLGGALIVDGLPVIGAHGGAGEYGHIPFGDRAQQCPCGAHGCWNLSIDGGALAVYRGDPPPDNPVEYARRLLSDTTSTRTQDAVREVATSLGRGIAGLVNLHDPDVVTLGGLAAAVRAAAPETLERAYTSGLMSFRKVLPPRIIDGIHGDEGPLRGAAIRGIDHITTPDALAEWADR